ncbi:MAG: HAD-IIA family hydrolase [Anaerolineaceae bacterium]|nr:MAG: HAD-IIA family hydrolase [Anaerolineaceae bacterium]
MKYANVKGVVLDMDGVLWRGDQPLPGLAELFEWLDESATPYALATNNSSKTPAQCAAKLASMGVPDVAPERIVTSSTATASYMAERYPAGTTVYALGMDAMREALDDAGFDVIADGQPDVVVAGVKFDLSYDDLRRATLCIRAGADFIGTNPDRTFPTPEGLVPGAGSIIAALTAATDAEPVIIGKPARPMFDAALAVTGTDAGQTLMIGDRLETDICGGRDAGLLTALVFTGVATPQDLTDPDNAIWPDVAYEGLPELLKAWAGARWYLDKMKVKKGRA